MIPLDDIEVLEVIQRLPKYDDKIPIRDLMKALWLYGPMSGKAALRQDIVNNQDPIEDLQRAAIRWAGIILAGISTAHNADHGHELLPSPRARQCYHSSL